jgi:hypothetical protein
MTTLVTADNKVRVPIRGTKPGRKYLVTQSGGEWRINAYTSEAYPSRNRREWPGRKGKMGLFDHLKAMADRGLKLERSEMSKQPIPPCRF